MRDLLLEKFSSSLGTLRETSKDDGDKSKQRKKQVTFQKRVVKELKLNEREAAEISLMVKVIEEAAKPNPVQYMTDVETKVVNFDKVKVTYFRGSPEQASSVDALALLDDGMAAFIEFKNGKANGTDIRLKAKSSLLIFCDLTRKDLKFVKDHLDLYLVYGPVLQKDIEEWRKKKVQKEPENANIKKHVAHKAKKVILPLGLGKLTHFFHDVHAYSMGEFQSVAARIQPLS